MLAGLLVNLCVERLNIIFSPFILRCIHPRQQQWVNGDFHLLDGVYLIKAWRHLCISLQSSFKRKSLEIAF